MPLRCHVSPSPRECPLRIGQAGRGGGGIPRRDPPQGRLPGGAPAYLASALWAQGRVGEALVEYREAIRLKPDDADAHQNLGVALLVQGQLDAAIAEYREAVRLKPNDPRALFTLAMMQQWRGDDEAAITTSRAALKIQPNSADDRRNIGLALLALGRPEEALAEFREAEKIAPNHRELPGEFRMVALAPRLQAVLRGDDRPANAAERIDFANLCYRGRRFAAAARLYAEALKEAPTLADDRESIHVLQAGRYAALAGCVEGRDDPSPTSAERAALRRRALDLLRSERDTGAQALGSDPKAAERVVAALRSWRSDYALAGVREADALAKMPEPERKDWQAFWADVDALLKKAEPPKP